MSFKKLLFGFFVVLIPCLGHAQTLAELLKKKDTVAAAAMIKKGADVNALNAQGASPLMDFCHFPDVDMIRFLLAHGAMVNQPRSAKGRTPLMIACAYWCGATICEMLIKKGADVNVAAQDGTTALMLAAQNEKYDVVELLLKNGANAHAKTASGKTALDFANAGKVEDYMTTSIKDTRFDKPAVIKLLENAK